MRQKGTRMISAFLLCLALTLSGCSTQPPAESDSTPPSSSADSSAAEENQVAASPEEGVEIATNGGEIIAISALEHQDETAESVVYYTSQITPEAMVAIYQALGDGLSGENIAVKLSTGEPPASNYLDPALIADLVSLVDGTIVENNTAYGGQRSSTAMHYQVAEDHGFTEIADFVVLDEDGSVTLPVEGGTMGGAIKNISIGMASQEGKCLIHTAGESHTSPWGGEQDPFLESMAEAGKSVMDALDGNMLFVSVMNHLSVDCDCDGNPAEPDMHDIGILASADPVALDQACVDLVYASQDDTASLIERMESRNAYHVLEHGEDIGLGSRTYRLVSIDE